ncbi:MAG: ion channel protein, partial [Subtercola sp.]|nr:ion channel protein [Subtercola sp.]
MTDAPAPVPSPASEPAAGASPATASGSAATTSAPAAGAPALAAPAANDNGAMPLRTLALLAIPAIIIGVVSALILFSLEWISGQFENYLWHSLPGAIGVDPNNGWWIFSLLTLSGVAVGLVVWLVPGHGARDSATTELIA